MRSPTCSTPRSSSSALRAGWRSSCFLRRSSPRWASAAASHTGERAAHHAFALGSRPRGHARTGGACGVAPNAALHAELAIASVTRANMRGVTWCVINEVRSGDWAIGGRSLTTEAVHASAAGQPTRPTAQANGRPAIDGPTGHSLCPPPSATQRQHHVTGFPRPGRLRGARDATLPSSESIAGVKPTTPGARISFCCRSPVVLVPSRADGLPRANGRWLRSRPTPRSG